MYFGIDFVGYLTIWGLITAVYQLRTPDWKFRLSLHNKYIRGCVFYAAVISLLAISLKFFVLWFYIENYFTIYGSQFLYFDFFIFFTFIVTLLVFVFFSTNERDILFWKPDLENVYITISKKLRSTDENKYPTIYNFLCHNLKDIINHSNQESLSITMLNLGLNKGLIEYIVKGNFSTLNCIFANFTTSHTKMHNNDSVRTFFTSLIREIILSDNEVFDDKHKQFIVNYYLTDPDLLNMGVYNSVYSIYPEKIKNFKPLERMLIINKSILNNIYKYKLFPVSSFCYQLMKLTDQTFTNFYSLPNIKRDSFFLYDIEIVFNLVEEVVQPPLLS